MRGCNNYIIKESIKLKNLLSIETTLLANEKLAYAQTYAIINQAKASLLIVNKDKVDNTK